MSEEPKASEETAETPAETITDAELDDVAGGAVKSAVISPHKDEDSFVSFPPQFISVMAYHEAGAAGSSAARRSVSDLFEKLAAKSSADE